MSTEDGMETVEEWVARMKVDGSHEYLARAASAEKALAQSVGELGSDLVYGVGEIRDKVGVWLRSDTKPVSGRALEEKFPSGSAELEYHTPITRARFEAILEEAFIQGIVTIDGRWGVDAKVFRVNQLYTVDSVNSVGLRDTSGMGVLIKRLFAISKGFAYYPQLDSYELSFHVDHNQIGGSTIDIILVPREGDGYTPRRIFTEEQLAEQGALTTFDEWLNDVDSGVWALEQLASVVGFE